MHVRYYTMKLHTFPGDTGLPKDAVLGKRGCIICMCMSICIAVDVTYKFHPIAVYITYT